MALGLFGCGDISSNPKKDITAASGPVGAKSTILVANEGDGSLIAFDPPSNAKGNTLPLIPEVNISPTRRFPKSVVGPMGLFLDIDSSATTPRNTLYVANANGNAIDIYENVDTQNFAIGSAMPTRSISGTNTRLDHPFAVAYDATNNQLFVANRDGNSVLRFQDTSPPTLNGNIAPSGVLIGVESTIFFPRGIAVDPSRDRLYISNVGNDSILAYNNITTVGGTPADCFPNIQTPPPNPSRCNRPPFQIISPHDALGLDPSSPDPNRMAGQLDVPFGIFIDNSLNPDGSRRDRLYVANTGFNQPGVLIYESASTRDGKVFPERVILTNNDLLPASCTPTVAVPFPDGCNTSQFGVPTGVTFDAVNNVLYVVNNNNANNINLSGSGNIDSTAVLAFSDPITSIDDLTKCPLPITGSTPPKVCALPPDRRLGGDVTPDANSLTNPVGIAVDPDHGTIYVSNPGANNILSFALDGNINPFKINSGDTFQFDKDKTLLESPSGFFYDKDLDRLFITNFTSEKQTPNLQITVFDQVSTKNFSNTAPSWSLQSLTNIASPKGVYVDKGRKKLLVLSTSAAKTGLVVYNLDNITGFPTNTEIGPTGTTILLPTSPTLLTSGLTPGGPTSMAVAETVLSGDVYIADKGNNSIIVFNLDDPAKNRTISSSAINQPSGLFIDTAKDTLYITNTGNNTVLAVRDASSQSGNIDTVVPDPKRTLSTATLSSPIAPTINMNADRLFLISRGNNSIFVFDKASTLSGTTGPSRTIFGDKTRLDFSHPGLLGSDAAALLFHDRGNGETLFLGQPVGVPKDQTCTLKPLECPRGALLAFGTEGKVTPNRIFSGGDAALSTPATIALDTVNDILYVADQGDKTVAGDDTIMIITGASTLDSNIASTSPNITKFTNSTLLNNPAGLFIDGPNNRLYIANSGGTTVIPGFLSVQVDSTIVTGRGTSFKTGPDRLFPGDILTINNQSVTVAKIKDDLTLSLVSRWTAPTHLDDPTGIPGPRGFVSKCSMAAPATPCNILVFDNADQLGQGSPSPSQTITNSAINRPHGLTVGTVGTVKLVYVANTGGDSVLIFNNGILKATLTGNLTRIGRPVDVAFDSSLDILYVLNRLDQEILVFDGVSTMTGTVNISPARVISPVNKGVIDTIESDTQFTLTAPYTGRTATGMTYGREGAIFSETTFDFFLFGRINVTNGSTTVTGSGDKILDGTLVKGTRFTTQLKVGDTIQVGTSLFTRPTGLFLDEANDLLYVTDQVANAVHIFNDASLAEGDAEHRTISGDNTGLHQPSAITVNPKTP